MEFERVIRGILKYLDREIYPSMADWQRLIARMAVGRVVNGSDSIKAYIMSNGFLRTFAVVNQDGSIDIDGLIRDMSAVMTEQPLEIDLPMFGKFKFTQDDIQKLYQYIKET